MVMPTLARSVNVRFWPKADVHAVTVPPNEIKSPTMTITIMITLAILSVVMVFLSGFIYGLSESKKHSSIA